MKRTVKTKLPELKPKHTAGCDEAGRALDAAIKEILNSPIGGGHYGRRKGGGIPAAKSESSTAAKRPPRKGSWSEAFHTHHRLIFRLKKYGTGKREQELHRKLIGCKRKARCASPACPMCTYAVQGVMAALINQQRSFGIKMDACLTIIPQQRIEWGGNEAVELEMARRQVGEFREGLDAAFKGSGVSTVIGAVDLTANEFPNGEFQAHSQPHLHALVFHVEFKSGERKLRKRFASEGSVNRPVLVAAFDGKPNWLRYIFKYPNRRGIRKQDDTGKWKDVSYKPLTVQQLLQQALILDNMGWSDRLYLRGLELKQSAQVWRLVLTDFRPQVRTSSGRGKSRMSAV